MKKPFLTILFSFCFVPFFSQEIVKTDSVENKVDSIVYSRNLILEEGIYMNYYDFRTDQPITKNVIKTNEDKSKLDFFDKVVDNHDYITFAFEGYIHNVNTDSIWGYCQNNTIYINYQNNFCRIPVFGNISHFIASVIVYSNNPYYANNPYNYGYGMMNTTTMQVKTKEIRQFMLDFYSGKVVDYSLENLLSILSRDKQLYTEFTALKRRKQRDMMGLYLRKYNEAHPIYYPKKR